MKDEDSFDLELEEFNSGKLPASHVFNLGKPGEILQNCGFPAEHRIELAAARLRMKATQGNHPFDVLDIQGLSVALQKPVAVFEYGDKSKSQNVIVNLEKDGKNFLVGVFFNQIRDGFEVSSIRGLFNRDNLDWIHWIQQGKMIYGNKEKIQVLAEQQRTNLADVHNKEARTSSDSYYLDSVDNILQSFGDVKDIYTKDYPGYAEQKERFEIFKKFRSAYQKVEAINVLDAVQEADEFYDALKSNNREVIARYTDAVENPELADAAKSIIEEQSFSQKAEKQKVDVKTYRFQSGETLSEIIQGNSDFPTEAALLDNLIDGNIREVYEYASEEEQKVLRQFASSRNDYDIDMKNLAVQTDCVSRWIAARHWNPEMQEFQEDYVNHAAVAEFPYKLPWEMKAIEETVLKSESKEKATEFVLSKLKSAGVEIISDKDEFENTLAELKGNDEIIQRMAESFEKSEKLRLDSNSVLRANEEVRDVLTEALDKTAEPLKEVVYSRENYVKIFEDGVIQSPVETIKMGTNQFIRLCPPDRNNLMGAIYETMTKPSIVLEKETFDEKSESFKPVHVYGKSFINQDNDHKRAVESIIVFKDGQNIAASLHNKTISALVKQIKTADDIIYLDKEVSRVATFSLKAGDSHVVKETEEFLSSAGQKSLPLWSKSYDTGKILSISDLLAKGEIEGGKLEITKDNFDKYFNIFNQNIRVYKDKPNKIASDLFSFYVKPEDKPEMKQWLESQGYKINESQRSERAVLSEYTVSDGTTYGFAYNGKIYLNPDFTDSNVAVHEYTHLWDEYTKKTNPQLWEKGKDVFKETHIWQEVKNDPNYADIADNDDLVLSEVHSRICGKMAQEVLERIAREDGEIAKDRAIDWNKEVNDYLFSEHGLFAKENLGNERQFIEEFMSLPVKDLFNENREINLNSPSQDELGNYRVTLGKVDMESAFSEETISQATQKSINEQKTKMPDQLVYAAARVGQVIEQRTLEAQSIVNPTRVDRLSTISVPLNKEYNEDFPLSTEKNMSETQKSINEQKTKLQILEQEDKEQLEAMVMTARETIKESLAQDAVPLVEIEFSKANYDRLFPRAIVQTPIETVKLGENQFEKLDAKDRKRFLLATFQTLATPDLVIDEEREGSHSHNYIKSFIFDEKTKAVQDVVVNINGENISITAHPRDINNVVNKIKMPDQLVYAAARVGQVIEQRVQNELGIVNPTRADRLSTISVPLNKEYNMENALSIISEFQTFKGQKTESEFQKKIDEMKKTIEARNMQEVETVTSEKKAPAKKQTTRTKADIIKQAAKDFSEAIKDGLAPFFDTKDDFQKIIMRPSAIVNAANGRPFSGESQLLAQIYHQRQKMEGEIVTSIAGAKSAGTKVLDTPESRQKNFALTDTSVLAEKNSIIRTRYFMPESCEEPEKIYSQTLQQQRPEKIRSYRDLIRHFENIPNGQKEISDIRIRIAHEHLKEIQSRFAIKEEKTLSVEEIEERKNFLRNYFERLPADYRDSERGAFEDTFGIQLDPEKTLKINLQRNFKDIDFAELKENTKKSIELENRKLNNFIEKNTMENKKLASIFKDEYKTQVKEEKQTSKNLKIEAIGIKEPETFLGKYLAACNSNAEFVTDKDTVEQVKKNLEKKLEENFKLEKYDILKEIGQQAQSISNETTKQISFEKAHSNKKNLGKAVDISAEISPLGMGK